MRMFRFRFRVVSHFHIECNAVGARSWLLRKRPTRPRMTLQKREGLVIELL